MGFHRIRHSGLFTSPTVPKASRPAAPPPKSCSDTFGSADSLPTCLRQSGTNKRQPKLIEAGRCAGLIAKIAVKKLANESVTCREVIYVRDQSACAVDVLCRLDSVPRYYSHLSLW